MTEITDPWLRLHYESGQVPMKDIRGVFRTLGYDLEQKPDKELDPESWAEIASLHEALYPDSGSASQWGAFRDAAARLGYRPAWTGGRGQEDTTEDFGEAPVRVGYREQVAGGRAEARERIVGQTLGTLKWQSLGGGVATPPVYQGDVGVDLSTVLAVMVMPGQVTYVPLGVKFAAPPGAWIFLLGRSSLASKLGLAMVPGVIDNGFRGEMLAGLYPIGGTPVELPAGTRVAQAILVPMFPTHLVEVTELPPSDRGENGFGSTGGH
jgi:dUTP pyrophosphatase